MNISKNALLRAVRDYRATEPKIRFYEPKDVKPKMLAHVIRECCPEIAEKDVIAVLDNNYPRRSKFCLLLTQDTLYFADGCHIQSNISKHWVRISDMVATSTKTNKDVYHYVEVVHADGTSEWIYTVCNQEDLYDLFSKMIAYGKEESKNAPPQPQKKPSDPLENRVRDIMQEVALLKKQQDADAKKAAASQTMQSSDPLPEVFDILDVITGLYCITCHSEFYPEEGERTACCPVCGTIQTAAEAAAFNRTFKQEIVQSIQPQTKSERELANEKAHALFEKGNYRAAMEYYMAAVKLGSVVAMYNIAVCYNNLYANEPLSKADVKLLFSAWEWLMKAEKHGYEKNDSDFYRIKNAVGRELVRKKAFDFEHAHIWTECVGYVSDGHIQYAEYLARHADTDDQLALAEQWVWKCVDLPYGEGFSNHPMECLYLRRKELASIYPEKKQLHLEKALELALDLKSRINIFTIISDFTILSLMCDLGRLEEAESWADKNNISRSDRKMLNRRIKLERQLRKKR